MAANTMAIKLNYVGGDGILNADSETGQVFGDRNVPVTFNNGWMDGFHKSKEKVVTWKEKNPADYWEESKYDPVEDHPIHTNVTDYVGRAPEGYKVAVQPFKPMESFAQRR